MKEKLFRVDYDVHKMIKEQAVQNGLTIKAYLRKLAYENMKRD